MKRHFCRHFCRIIWIALLLPVGLASCSKSPDEVPALQNESLTTTEKDPFLWLEEVEGSENNDKRNIKK